MKKNILKFSIILILICLIVFGVYYLVFNNKVDVQALAENNISEMCENYFTATDKNTTLKLCSGVREGNYSLNGVHEENTNYCLLIFKTSELNVSSPTFVVEINGNSYNGLLEENPYDNTFVSDIAIDVPNDAVITASVTVKNSEYNYVLENVSSLWRVSFEDAKQIGINALMEDLEKCVNGKQLNCELYVKAITDVNNEMNSYFYYVSMVDSNSNSKGVVIDVNSGEVVNM